MLLIMQVCARAQGTPCGSRCCGSQLSSCRFHGRRHCMLLVMHVHAPGTPSVVYVVNGAKLNVIAFSSAVRLYFLWARREKRRHENYLSASRCEESLCATKTIFISLWWESLDLRPDDWSLLIRPCHGSKSGSFSFKVAVHKLQAADQKSGRNLLR